MFRRQEDTIGQDPVFPADLKALGFFINKLGHIRMIEAPEKGYVYHATTSDRVNELRREAMQECSRQEMEKRLSALGINRIYLPDFTTTKPNAPHVPILSPSPEILKTRKRIIVLVNDAIHQDIGILAYRQLQRELGLNGASVIDFVKELIKRSATGDTAEKYENIFDDGSKVEDENDTPALVVLNTAQLLYSHKYNKTMTMSSWSAMPRKSVAHAMIRIHEENRVPGHRNPKDHVKWVFDNVICNPDRVAPNAEVYVVAIEGGTEIILNILEEDFAKYGPRITAMSLIASLIDDSQTKNASVRALLHQRTREWRYSALTNNPQHCTELPEGYSSQTQSSETKIIRHMSWNESVPQTGATSGITRALHRLVVNSTPLKKGEDETTPTASDADTEWSSGQAATCPTFAGGPETTGECILTNPAVRLAVLSFFEEVAQDPENYCNPDIKLYAEAPQPTPDNPLLLDPDNLDVASFSSLPPEMTPEQAEVDMAKETLEQMELALKACPVDVPELQSGRTKLIERISNRKVKIEKLEKKTLATGGLTAGAAPEQRENWKPQKEGTKVKFAGTEVDSELLKAAGLMDTADEELEKLGQGGV